MREITKYSFQLGSFSLLVGLSFSEAMISIGVALIFLSGILNWKNTLHALSKNIPAQLLVLLFFLHFLSSFYTSDVLILWDEVRIKLPLFMLPIGMILSGQIEKKELKLLYLIFSVAVNITAAFSLWNYIQHYEEIQIMISHSKPVPIFGDLSHIYFSVMLALSIFSGITTFLFFRRKSTLIAYFALFLGIFSFASLHILSARTGIVSFYLSTGLLAFIYFLQQKKYLLLLGAFVGAFSMGILAYFAVPSLHNRVDNTLMDLRAIKTGEENINHLSLGMRFVAWDNAIEIIKENPIFGTGAGDAQSEMNRKYITNHPEIQQVNWLLPHNQLLEFGITFGLIGVITYLLAFLFPIPEAIRQKNYALLFIIFLVLTANLAEAMLERQVGVSMLPFFFLLNLPKSRQA